MSNSKETVHSDHIETTSSGKILSKNTSNQANKSLDKMSDEVWTSDTKQDDQCSTSPSNQEQTSLDIMSDEVRTDDTPQCDQCAYLSEEATATVRCVVCKEDLCSVCETRHRKVKSTQNHQLISVGNVTTTLRPLKTQETGDIERKPGKPVADGQPTFDSIRLIWSAPHGLDESFVYQIRYKTTNPPSKWKFYEEQFSESCVNLTNLKSSTTFVFQVRIVTDEEEGPYSDLSDKISTTQSAASHLKEFSTTVPNDEGSLEKRKLSLEEIEQARNKEAKTRKFYLGDPTPVSDKEKTLLLVGATGSGKSTLVDGFINYILGVSWEDPYRYTIVDLEEEEQELKHDQAISQTQWITTYCINPLRGSRLDYKLNIIDTPGFGDTRGIEQDQRVVDQIRQLFTSDGQKGIVFLDSVCFLAKAPDARLTASQQYIFNSILSLFGKDIANNITIMITFADGKTPPVIAALNTAKLPYDKYFAFNNSGLYADNSGVNTSSLSPMFWEMGCKSFASFFAHLKTMQTKSLHQSQEVLKKRRQMQLTIENITPLVTNGLGKVEEMRGEISLLNKHKTEIEENKDFTYTVTETIVTKMPTPAGKYVTNCLRCNTTCHRDCCIPRDEEKDACEAMDLEGFCTQCVKKCNWKQHVNIPYIFEYKTVEVSKTYAAKEEKYRHASDEKMTVEKVVVRMARELDQLEDEILRKMAIVAECNNKLKEIALRPDPLCVKEHIDILIESEKQEARPGFQMRIAALKGFREKANIDQVVQNFRSTVAAVQTESSVREAKEEDPETKGILEMAFDIYAYSNTGVYTTASILPFL